MNHIIFSRLRSWSIGREVGRAWFLTSLLPKFYSLFFRQLRGGIELASIYGYSRQNAVPNATV